VGVSVHYIEGIRISHPLSMHDEIVFYGFVDENVFVWAAPYFTSLVY
jgi:hypothetical protein